MTHLEYRIIIEDAINILYNNKSHAMCFALRNASRNYNSQLSAFDHYIVSKDIFKQLGIDHNDFYKYINPDYVENAYRNVVGLWIEASTENNIVRAKYLTSKLHTYMSRFDSK